MGNMDDDQHKEAREHWEDKANMLLLGRRIVKVYWMSAAECEKRYGWYKRPVCMMLDDGTVIIPQQDDEGNDGGALLHVNPKETETSKHYPGQKFIKTDVLPVF